MTTLQQLFIDTVDQTPAIKKTLSLIYNKIKALTGKDCNIQITTLKELETFKRVVENYFIRKNNDPYFRLNIQTEYVQEPTEMKTHKIFYLYQAVQTLERLHSEEDMLYNEGDLNNFIIDDKDSMSLLDTETKTPIAYESETINDFQVFQMYVSELVNQYPYLQYLEDEINKIIDVKYSEQQ